MTTTTTGHAGALSALARRRLAWFAAALSCSLPLAAAPATGTAQQTVCTITVNSADEKETFRRYLPAAKYKFVELVERGRPDWLSSACRARVSCDVLIISGHYDGGNEFFSDQFDMREHLPVDELERVSCSDSCPGLFSNLKEVHLFGCDSLNSEAQNSASAEVMRSLLREGHSLKEAQRQVQRLNAGHGQSGRDRMRQVFKDVPVIYGFSSVAPLGPTAAATLNSYFRSTGTHEIGQGRPSSRLLGSFAPHGMTVTQGMTERDPHAAVRRDVCQFVDDRLTDAQRIGFVHQLLQRETAQARVHLDRIQRFAKALEDPARRPPEVTRALGAIAGDTDARARFLGFARDADQPTVRARMLDVARDLGWLSADERWQELRLMLGQMQARNALGVTEVDLACTLNRGHELDGAFSRNGAPGSPANGVAHAALRACLGSADDRGRTLEGLVSPSEGDVLIARTYLRHRPLAEAGELRGVVETIARMPPSPAQVRALEALGRQRVSERGILDQLIDLFAKTPSRPVQAAIAGILIRADLRPLAKPQLLQTLQANSRASPAGDDMLDALIRRLQSS